MAEIFGTWHGGVNYACPDVERDVERFTSVKDAASALKARALMGGVASQTFQFVDRDVEDTLTPNADVDASITLYRTHPGTTDAGPSHVLILTPRGAVKDYLTDRYVRS